MSYLLDLLDIIVAANGRFYNSDLLEVRIGGSAMHLHVMNSMIFHVKLVLSSVVF